MNKTETFEYFVRSIKLAGTAPFLFSNKTLRMFGDTMENYDVRKTSVLTGHYSRADGNYHTYELVVWELFRINPVGDAGLTNSVYFKIDTLEQVFPT